jgi:hypothetical protein
VTRPPEITSSVATCLAIRTALCIGRTSTQKVICTCSVTAAAAERVTMTSGFGKVMRSPAARLA